MIGQQQFHIHLSYLSDSRTIGGDLHSITTFSIAGSDQLIYADEFYQAYSAGCDFVYIFKKAQMRDMYSNFLRSLHYGSSFGDAYLLSVYS